ncbi:MAG: hypothetical protein ABIJ56_03380 [Pseudomonadota bacterium]
MVALLLVLNTGPLLAQPIDLRVTAEGAFDYFATGAPLAIDGPDADTTQVDMLNQPASVEVTAADVPATGTVVLSFLYWAGTIADQADCATAPSATDDDVELTLPGAEYPAVITADICFCAAGASSYDIQACRADITSLVAASGMLGTFTVDAFDARIRNGSTDNASFSLVLIYEEPALLPPRRYALYDGVEEFYEGSRTLALSGLDVDTPAHGDLTWYVLDGDIGGTPPELVNVTGTPGGGSTDLSDAINPANNPMNRTINTTTPVQTGVLGVDIDWLDISSGLTPEDTGVDMTYTAGGDKYWVVYNIVGIDVYRALIHPQYSYKTWELQVDADASGGPTPGDTVRYTIHLHNSGTAPGYVSVTDTIPGAAASWWVVSDGGGTDLSTDTTLIIEDIYVGAGDNAEVIFDMVLAPGTEGTIIENSADFDGSPDGNSGTLTADPLHVGSGLDDTPPEEAELEEDVPDAHPEEDVTADGFPDAADAADEDADVPGEDAATDAHEDTPVDAWSDTQPDDNSSPGGCGCLLV